MLFGLFVYVVFMLCFRICYLFGVIAKRFFFYGDLFVYRLNVGKFIMKGL